MPHSARATLCARQKEKLFEIQLSFFPTPLSKIHKFSSKKTSKTAQRRLTKQVLYDIIIKIRAENKSLPSSPIKEEALPWQIV
jgi:hypothetical protein